MNKMTRNLNRQRFEISIGNTCYMVGLESAEKQKKNLEDVIVETIINKMVEHEKKTGLLNNE